MNEADFLEDVNDLIESSSFSEDCSECDTCRFYDECYSDNVNMASYYL